jgi:hypothetical protein
MIISLEFMQLSLERLPTPFYQVFCRRAGGRASLGFLGILFFMFLSHLVACLLSISKYMPLANILAFLGAFAVCFGIWALNYIYSLTLKVIAALKPHLSDGDQERRVAASFRLTYSNKYLVLTGVLFSLRTQLTGIAQPQVTDSATDNSVRLLHYLV